MKVDDLVAWTRAKLAELSGEVPVTCSEEMPRSGRAATPLFDLLEDEREVRLVVEVPAATPRNTRVAWDSFDVVSVYVQRSPPDADWRRDVVFPLDADLTKARATVKDGVLVVRAPKTLTLGDASLPAYAA